MWSAQRTVILLVIFSAIIVISAITLTKVDSVSPSPSYPENRTVPAAEPPNYIFTLSATKPVKFYTDTSGLMTLSFNDKVESKAKIFTSAPNYSMRSMGSVDALAVLFTASTNKPVLGRALQHNAAWKDEKIAKGVKNLCDHIDHHMEQSYMDLKPNVNLTLFIDAGDNTNKRVVNLAGQLEKVYKDDETGDWTFTLKSLSDSDPELIVSDSEISNISLTFDSWWTSLGLVYETTGPGHECDHGGSIQFAHKQRICGKDLIEYVSRLGEVLSSREYANTGDVYKI